VRDLLHNTDRLIDRANDALDAINTAITERGAYEHITALFADSDGNECAIVITRANVQFWRCKPEGILSSWDEIQAATRTNEFMTAIRAAYRHGIGTGKQESSISRVGEMRIVSIVCKSEVKQ